MCLSVKVPVSRIYKEGSKPNNKEMITQQKQIIDLNRLTEENHRWQISTTKEAQIYQLPVKWK